ncbi:MAG: hypothetical protein ABI949_14645, partial [Ilumatobacteraceae bacterium]
MPPVRSSRVLVAGALTFAAIFFAVLWADPWGESVSGRVDDITELVVIGLTAAACGHRARRSQVGSRRTWILLAAFAGLWVIGSAIWLVSDLTGSTLPYPSVADVAFLLAVPAGAAALLCFPSPATATSRIRTLLDAAVMAGSLLFVSWAVLLGPVVRISSSANAALAVAIAYPVGDVIILALAMHLLARAGRHRTIVLTLSAGIAAIAISDSAYAWVSTFHPAASGDLTGAGWVLGFLLIAVAAVMAPSDLRGAAASQQARPASPMVIYGCVLVSVGVAAAELLNGRGFDMTLGWIEIAIWLLLVARQWLSSLEVA